MTSFFLQEGIDGHVTGVDLWDAKDQSQSSAVAALENARKEDVRMYVEVRAADARELPFSDASFDLVVSSLCIHNIGEGLGR
jgi:arsenite methyltransferase